ncbi:Ldh family oxidoreductase [Leucobacter sp. GX24907]
MTAASNVGISAQKQSKELNSEKLNSEKLNSEQLSWSQIERLCSDALRAAGADEASSASLARATVEAERRGRPAVGVAHLFDYIDSLRAGRINGTPSPQVQSRRSSVVTVDGDRGVAQLPFDLVRDEFIDAVGTTGIGLLGIGRTFPVGELGFYTAELAEAGFIALAGTNSPVLMSVFNAPIPVTGTNPFSFAVPSADGIRLIDQASSEVAWVSIRDAALRGESIPAGWAIDSDGNPTTDAAAAIEGALLPFGGHKGANITVMIELLAALAGGRFSLDAASFTEGEDCPEVGLWIIAIDPEAFDPGFVARADAHFARLSEFIGHEFGRRREPLAEPSIPNELLTRLTEAAGD